MEYLHTMIRVGDLDRSIIANYRLVETLEVEECLRITGVELMEIRLYRDCSQENALRLQEGAAWV